MSCTVNPSYDTEVAFMQKPIFFGETKVQDEPLYLIHVPRMDDNSGQILTCFPLSILSNSTTCCLMINTPLEHKHNANSAGSKGKNTRVAKETMVERWYETFIESMFKAQGKRICFAIFAV